MNGCVFYVIIELSLNLNGKNTNQHINGVKIMSKNTSIKGTVEQKVMDDSSSEKKVFTEPKLTFVEPELTKHGDATQITKNNGGFFGTFVPPG